MNLEFLKELADNIKEYEKEHGCEGLGEEVLRPFSESVKCSEHGYCGNCRVEEIVGRTCYGICLGAEEPTTPKSLCNILSTLRSSFFCFWNV